MAIVEEKIRLEKSELSAGLKGLVRLGSISWSYDSWKGLVYQPQKEYKIADYLLDYSKYYNTSEIDQWFWSLFPIGIKLPKTEIVKSYADNVPDDFIFTVKAPNSITLTNYYDKQPKNSKDFANKPNEHFLDIDLLKRFLERLEPMGKKLGPLMFQFEYLNKQKMPSLGAFTNKLQKFFDKAPKGIQYAIEIRNPNFIKAEFFDFLKELKLGFVLLDGHFMPPIQNVTSQFDIATSDYSIIRLFGNAWNENAGADIWDRISTPKDEELQTVASAVKSNAEKGVKTFINVKNQYEGSAPLTIQRLIERLK